MRSGDLDERIELQRTIETNDGGELVLTHETVETVWAKVIFERGAESFESARTNARVTVKFKMRWRDDVQTSWRIGWDGQFYEVVTVDRDKRRLGELWVTCLLVGAR